MILAGVNSSVVANFFLQNSWLLQVLRAMFSVHPTLRTGTPLVVPSSPNRPTASCQCQLKASKAARPFDPMRLASSTIARSFSATVIGDSTGGQLPIIQWLSYAIAAYAAYQLSQVQDEVRLRPGFNTICGVVAPSWHVHGPWRPSELREARIVSVLDSYVHFSYVPCLQTPSGDVCPRCEGTGKEACICNRWSDGDTGCQSCNYTGRTQCKACRGGGTAVPIAVAIRKDDPDHHISQ